MAFAIVARRGDGLGSFGGTTGDLNTTGARLIVLTICHDASTPIVSGDISDSKGNTYTKFGTGASSEFAAMSVFYCIDPIVGASHNVTISHAFAAIGVSFRAYSSASAPLIVTSSFAAAASATSLQPGSVVPGGDGRLFVAGYGCGNTSFSSIDSGFGDTDTVNFSSGSNYGVGAADKIQTTGGAENPTIAVTIADNLAVGIVVFQETGGGSAPDASYAEDSQPCEGSNGTITPTNTGGAITSSAVASGTLPTGYTLNANGTISKVGASMLAADIGSRTVFVNLTNASGTQSNVPVPIVITANPPQFHYAGTPFTKYAAHNSSTADVTVDGGPAVVAAGYALSSALGGLALNTTTGRLTFDPDLTEAIRQTGRTISGTSAGGQVGTTSIQLTVSFQFTTEGTNASGSDTSLDTFPIGGGAEPAGGFLRNPNASFFGALPLTWNWFILPRGAKHG